MSNLPTSTPHAGDHLHLNPSASNGDSLPSRPTPRPFASHDGSHSSSGTGTPIGFQRPHNKFLDNATGSAMRQPSPQPTHLGIPGTPHRVLSEDPGYIAAKFEGKQKQMEQGMAFPRCVMR